jgi:hypothetical protein
MKTLKAAAVALAVVLGLAAVMEPAFAGGRHHRGGPHGSVGVWGPGWWGGWGGWGWRGAWGPGWWGPAWGPGAWGPGWGPGWGSGWGGGGVWVTSPPQVVVVPQEPRIFVERDEVPASAPAAPPAAAPSRPQWWYWCASANAYYPYVSTCSEGWQRVTPQPVTPR